MKLAFYLAKKGNWMDKIIGWWTRPTFWKFWEMGLYSHVEIVFEDDMCFSSSPRDGGTRWTKIKDLYTSGKWDFVDLHMTDYQIRALHSECYHEQSKPYDWFCIFFSFLIPVDIQNNASWTCSEYVAKKVFNVSKAHRYSPNDMHTFAKIQDRLYRLWFTT